MKFINEAYSCALGIDMQVVALFRGWRSAHHDSATFTLMLVSSLFARPLTLLIFN